jgi:hypothetical protein
MLSQINSDNGGDSQVPEVAEEKSVGGFVKNAVASSGDVVKNIFTGLVNILNTDPDKNTVVNVAKLAGGLLASPVIIGHNLITGKNAGEEGSWQLNDKPLENLLQNLSDRYGSVDKFKETLYTDPAGTLLDAATILDPAAKGLGAVGESADAAKLAELTDAAKATGSTIDELNAPFVAKMSPSLATKAGKVLGSVGDAINPINALSGVVDWAKAGLENLGPKLEEANLRLTPTQRVNYASKLDDVTQYIAKELPAGSPASRYEAISQKAADMEDKVQSFLNEDARDATVDRAKLVKAAEGLKAEFSGERDALEIDRQIDGFKSLLESKYQEKIPVADLNQLKRSTFESAFNSAGTKVSDAVEYRLGDMLYDNIKSSTEGLGTKSLGQINKEYSTVITAKKLLKAAMGRPQVGFVDKLVSGAVGGIIGNSFGGPIPAAVGGFVGKTAAEHIPATGVKSLGGKAARIASKVIPELSPAAVEPLSVGSRLSTLTKPPQKSTSHKAKR